MDFPPHEKNKKLDRLCLYLMHGGRSILTRMVLHFKILFLAGSPGGMLMLSSWPSAP